MRFDAAEVYLLLRLALWQSDVLEEVGLKEHFVEEPV
jgi:hypothetical protein